MRTWQRQGALRTWAQWGRAMLDLAARCGLERTRQIGPFAGAGGRRGRETKRRKRTVRHSIGPQTTLGRTDDGSGERDAVGDEGSFEAGGVHEHRDPDAGPGAGIGGGDLHPGECDPARTPPVAGLGPDRGPEAPRTRARPPEPEQLAGYSLALLGRRRFPVRVGSRGHGGAGAHRTRSARPRAGPPCDVTVLRRHGRATRDWTSPRRGGQRARGPAGGHRDPRILGRSARLGPERPRANPAPGRRFHGDRRRHASGLPLRRECPASGHRAIRPSRSRGLRILRRQGPGPPRARRSPSSRRRAA